MIRKVQEMVDEVPAVCHQLLAKPDSRTTIPNPWLRDPESSRLRALIQSMGNYPKEKLIRAIEGSTLATVARTVSSPTQILGCVLLASGYCFAIREHGWQRRSSNL